MKTLILLIAFLYWANTHSRGQCADSSSHFTYRTQQNDSFRVTKTILTQGNEKVSIGYFMNGIARGKSFINKIKANGDPAWTKTITSPFSGGVANLECIAETSNGNLIVSTNSIQTDNLPFFYLVFSADGNLIHQVKFGLPANPVNLGNEAIRISLIAKKDADSMLMVLIHPVNNSGTRSISLLTISNNGQPGQAKTFTPPVGTFNSPYISACRVDGDEISLYGGAQFFNACKINGFEQPTYVYLKLNTKSGQVMEQKAYCSPTIGMDSFGNILGEGTDNDITMVFFQEDGSVSFTRRIWGLDPNGGDTLTRMFKVSRFDSNFNSIKSYYINTPKKFRWWLDWDSEIFIDRKNKVTVMSYDLPGKQLRYGQGDLEGGFPIQKKLSLFATGKNGTGVNTRILQPEPGYLISLNLVRSDDTYGYFDNIRIQEKDTSRLCFGESEDFLLTGSASVSPIPWPGTFSSMNNPPAFTTASFSITDYLLEKNTICNFVSRCDSIRLHGPENTCPDNTPVLISAGKNSHCDSRVDFIFDTSAVSAFTRINDTLISIAYNKPYSGFIYTQIANCPDLVDSMEIRVNGPLDPIDLGPDIGFCPGKSYSLDAYNALLSNYTWQNGSNDSRIIVSAPGIYYITAEDACGRVYTDTLEILRKNNMLDLGSDTLVCRNEDITLSVQAGYLQYHWEPSTSILQEYPHKYRVRPTENSIYSVAVEIEPGCILYDTIIVNVKDCPDYVFFPNAFTPNHDGLNDQFKPRYGSPLETYELRVYNRWGQLVFKTRNASAGWDGTLQGKPVDNGVFVWTCQYGFPGKPVQFLKGTVMVVR